MSLQITEVCIQVILIYLFGAREMTEVLIKFLIMSLWEKNNIY